VHPFGTEDGRLSACPSCENPHRLVVLVLGVDVREEDGKMHEKWSERSE
jgi:hypothetical protein